MDPHCTFGGYTFFINTIMDPQCILWRPYLTSLDPPSIGMPALGFEICHDICWVFVCSFLQVLRVYTLAWMSTKYFSHQFASSEFILWGAFCYTSKSLNWISVAYCLSLVASVTTPLQLVASVAGWLQSVANVVESSCHNDDTKEALRTSHVLGLKEETDSLGSNISQHLRELPN